MKIHTGFYFAIVLLFGQNVFGQTAFTTDSLAFNEMKSTLKQLGRISNAVVYDYENVDVVYNRCEWKVDPAVNYIDGSITVYFLAQSNLDSLTFDCSQYLTVDSILFHSSAIAFTRHDDYLVCDFPIPIGLSSLDSISIFYHGAPVETGNGSFDQGLHAGVPVMWTLSEPFGAKDWWPCRQNTSDKIDSIDVICQIPSGNKCASNGKLVSVDSIGGFLKYHWKSKYPIAPYLVAIAVTNYESFSDTVALSNSDTMQILNYVYPEQISYTQPALSVTPSLVLFYDSLLIPYPYSKEKYGNAQFGWGGGMEHQTMSFVGSFGLELIAHELVHQWFGDLLTCKSWSDIWLHEGFATYFSGLAIEKFNPNEYYSWKYTALQDIVSKPNGSVYSTDTTDLSRIFSGRLSYRKAGYVLNMLRWKFGDVLFFHSIKDYLNNNLIRYNYSTTDDLKNSFETITATDLTQFFDEWVYGQGFPVFNIEWSRVGNSIDMKIFQTTSDASVPFFHIPIPIQVGNSLTDTIVVVNANYSGQTFHFDIGFKPDFISVDPDLQIISGNNKVKEDLPPGSIDDQIAIYPNPTSGIVDVFSKQNSLKLNSFSVVDVCGNMIYSQKFSNNFKSTIDLSGLPDGIYLLEISTDLGYVHKKIIQHK